MSKLNKFLKPIKVEFKKIYFDNIGENGLMSNDELTAHIWA